MTSAFDARGPAACMTATTSSPRERGNAAAKAFKREEVRALAEINNDLSDVHAAIAELEKISPDLVEVTDAQFDVAQDQVAALVVAFDAKCTASYDAMRGLSMLASQRSVAVDHAPWAEAMKDTHWIARRASVVHELVVALSNAVELRRTAKKAGDAKVWIPPETFVRTTKKYWVTPEQATAIKAVVVRHLPVLEVNKSKPPPAIFEEAVRDSQIHNFLSSVYFDSDDAVCYHRRIAQEENSNLFRIRWYGGVMGPDGLPRPPNKDTTFFLELKTHHNVDITGQKSTKERLALKGSLVSDFLAGSILADEAVDKMVTITGVALDAEKLEQQKSLAKFIQLFVLQNRLKPKLRTVYHRTAFQLSDSNDVRISFDLPMYLVPELKAGGQPWHGDFLRLVHDSNFANAEPFPYGVLEVKTSENTPQWVEDELLGSGMPRLVEKFSKFQHCFAVTYTSAVKVTPFWMETMLKEERAGGIRTATCVEENAGRDGPARTARICDRDESTDADLNVMQSVNDGGASEQPASISSRVSRVDVGAALPPRTNGIARTKVEPRTYWANERVLLKYVMVAAVLIAVSMQAVFSQDNYMEHVFGLTMLALALFLVFYAGAVYCWRLRIIIRQIDGVAPPKRVDDPIGPVLTVFLIGIAAIVLFVVALRGSTTYTFTCPMLTPTCKPMQDVGPVNSSWFAMSGGVQLDLAAADERLKVCLAQDRYSSETVATSKHSKGVTTKEKSAWERNLTTVCAHHHLGGCKKMFIQYEHNPNGMRTVPGATRRLRFYVSTDANLTNIGVNARTLGLFNAERRAIYDCSGGGIVFKYFETPVLTEFGELNTTTINKVLDVGADFFLPNATLSTPRLEIQSAQKFAIDLAGVAGHVRLIATFPTVDARALQLLGGGHVSLSVVLPGNATYSAKRQGQMLIESLESKAQAIVTHQSHFRSM